MVKPICILISPLLNKSDYCLRAKLANWKVKFLSLAGRVVLIY